MITFTTTWKITNSNAGANGYLKIDLVLERPPSQMSYLDQFLKETNTSSMQNMYDNVPPTQAQLYQGGSIESEDGDIEDNRAPSIVSSKSNLSEVSTVSIIE